MAAPVVSHDNNEQAMATSSMPNNGSSSEAASARAAAQGTLWSFLFKLLSFAATQWTLRSLNPVALGKASIQLELLLSTSLFLAREGFRLAITKPTTDFEIAKLSIPVSTLISIVACSIHWYSTRQQEWDYRMAGVLYCMASWIEGWAEPCVLWCLREIQLGIKARAEGMATLIKTVSLVVLLPLLPDYPICAFGLSQVLYAITYTLILYRSTSLLPWNKATRINVPSLQLVMIFTLQGIFKHVLTEGDRIVLTSLQNHYHQGVYAMASAYGGMVARLVLQPLEENARSLWSRHSNNPTCYTALVHLVLHVGVMFSTVAVNYTSLLLQVLAGRTWGRNAEAASVLSAFCVYTAFMAWNGMTEAFVYAVAHTGSQVTSLTIAHGIVGVFFMAIAPLFVNRYGTLGLVMANCIAMGVRALYAIYFAAKYYCQVETKNNEKIAVWEMAKRLIQDMFPPPIVLATYGVAFCVTRASLLRMQDYEREYSTEINTTWLVTAAQHIAVGIVSVVMVAMCTFWYDAKFWQSIVCMFREKQE